MIWLNYNSAHVIDLSKKSLDAVMAIDYPNYELILVDNNSTDGSKEAIENHLFGSPKHLKLKFIKSKSNLGWTGGVNLAYRNRDSDSDYVVITQNDLIVKKDLLTKLVQYMQEHNNIGVIQGIVTQLHDNSKIDSSGMMLDETLQVYPPYQGKAVEEFNKPACVSYIEGTLPMYRVSAVKHVLGDNNTLYISAGFIYYLEDVFVSLMMWQKGWSSLVLPIIVGSHRRNASSSKVFVSLRLACINLRNQFALLYMTNSRSKPFFFIKNLRKLVISRRSLSQRQMIATALVTGIQLGRQLKKKYGIINVYAAPLLKTRWLKRLQV